MLWLMGGMASAQVPRSVEVVVQRSFSTGDISMLDTITAAVVSLQLGGERRRVSRAQGLHAVGRFVRQAPPAVFHIVHRGSAGQSIHYMIGRYVSQQNRAYRVYIMFKYSEPQRRYIIHEIRIDSL